jgi:hypothetical protein
MSFSVVLVQYCVWCEVYVCQHYSFQLGTRIHHKPVGPPVHLATVCGRGVDGVQSIQEAY